MNTFGIIMLIVIGSLVIEWILSLHMIMRDREYMYPSKILYVLALIMFTAPIPVVNLITMIWALFYTRKIRMKYDDNNN